MLDEVPEEQRPQLASWEAHGDQAPGSGLLPLQNLSCSSFGSGKSLAILLVTNHLTSMPAGHVFLSNGRYSKSDVHQGFFLKLWIVQFTDHCGKAHGHYLDLGDLQTPQVQRPPPLKGSQYRNSRFWMLIACRAAEPAKMYTANACSCFARGRFNEPRLGRITS